MAFSWKTACRADNRFVPQHPSRTSTYGGGPGIAVPAKGLATQVARMSMTRVNDRLRHRPESPDTMALLDSGPCAERISECTY